MSNLCQCGHAKSAHIYEEGACRPGFVCEHECTKFTAIPVKTSEEIEAMANETFEPTWYKANKYYAKKEMPVFGDDIPGRQDSIEKAWVSGYDACREQMQDDIEELKHTLANIKLNEEWPVVKQLIEERAKAQKLVAALERISEWGWSEIEGHGRCHNLQGVHADEAIKEYKSQS